MNLTDFIKKAEKLDDKRDKEPHRKFMNGLWIESDEEKNNWKKI